MYGEMSFGRMSFNWVGLVVASDQSGFQNDSIQGWLEKMLLQVLSLEEQFL